jgi:hypothetical protein
MSQLKLCRLITNVLIEHTTINLKANQMNCIQNLTTCPCLELMAEHSTTISSVGGGITIGSGFDTTTLGAAAQK